MSDDEEERRGRRTRDEHRRRTQTSGREQRSRRQRDTTSRQETTAPTATGAGHGRNLRHWHRDLCGHEHGDGEWRDRMATRPSRVGETCRDSLQNTLVGRSENSVTPGTLDGFARAPPSGECVGNQSVGFSSTTTDGAKTIRVAASTGVDDSANPTPDRRVKVRRTEDWERCE